MAGPALGVGAAWSAGDTRALAANPAAVNELVQAVSLDVMSEASMLACVDVGAASGPALRDAWVAWRERQQLAFMRSVLNDLRGRSHDSPSWDRITQPMRQRVQADANPEQTCAALVRDFQAPAMDVAALYPQARPVALALVQARLAYTPAALPVLAGAATGQFMLPSQIPALAKGRHWLAISEEAAQRELGPVYVKGRVTRNPERHDRFYLLQTQGEREASQHVYLKFNAEALVGREVVLRGLVTSINEYSIDLAAASLVADASGLAPSPLAQAPMARKEVDLQRVLTPPGRGIADKDLAAVVVHGEANHNNGTSWDEDVRFLLRDGSVYRRTEMPPDQLNVAASRQLEPQRWGRWRKSGSSYEMQAQDDDGRPLGGWEPVKHLAARPWPQDTRLEGSFSRSRFDGSLVMGGRSSTRGIRFSRDGRFERSFSALSSSGTLAAVMNNTVIAGSASGDGKGSSRTGGGTVGTGTGTVGVSSGTRTQDDGASRRGRYQLSGYVLTLDYDDGHHERLLSFGEYDDSKTVYAGDGSYSLDK